MKSYELKPTPDNLMNTFSSDAIGRSQDVCHFANILNQLEDSCSIALDGNWGSGKTFFVKQVKMILDTYNDFVQSISSDDKSTIKKSKLYSSYASNFINQVTVYYDAWENDNDEDPVLSLIYTIVKTLNNDFTIVNDASFIKTASDIIEFFSGKNWSSIVENFRSRNPLEKLQQEKQIDEEIKVFLKDLLFERGDRLVVFIDELDRCNPIYAVKLLERIKHFFSDDRITFVFSVNITELQHTIKKYYGENFDACRYLDRFFDLRVSLPPANITKFYQSCDFDPRYRYDVTCHAVINAYRLSLREIAKYIRLTKIAAYTIAHKDTQHYLSSGARFCLHYITPILLGLKITNFNQYIKFIQGADGSPLLYISKYVEDNMFEDILVSSVDNSSSFNQSNQESLIESKLNEIYHALFQTDFTNFSTPVKIGKCSFSKNEYDNLMKVVSLLSHYTTFEY